MFERGAIDPDGETHVFVVDSIRLPRDATEAYDLGQDVDADAECRRNNAFGQVLAIVFRFFDSDGTAIGNEYIKQGRILHLVEVQTTSLDDADGVAVRIHVGIDEDGFAGDNFTGAETFAVDTTVPDEPMTGAIADGVLEAYAGEVPLQIAIPRVDVPHLTSLTAARIEVRLVDGGLEARLAGAMTKQRVDALAEHAAIAMDAIAQEDCPDGRCVPGSTGEELLDLFDRNDDGRLDPAEVRDNDLIQSNLLSPDMDLYDSEGRLSPGCDQVKDTLSVGLGFTAVPARFASPPPSMPGRR